MFIALNERRKLLESLALDGCFVSAVNRRLFSMRQGEGISAVYERATAAFFVSPFRRAPGIDLRGRAQDNVIIV